MGQRLRSLFFFVLGLLTFFALSRCHALFRFVELLFELLKFQLNIGERFAFHAMRQSEFGGEQNIFFGNFGVRHQRGVSARAFEDN